LPLFILAFCAGVGTANGQTEELPKVDTKNSLVKGAWALQFQINNNFSLSSFQGSTLSAKRHYSNKKAIRFGVSLNGSFSDQDQSSEVPGMVGPKNESDENSQSIGINTQYVFYPAPDKSVNFFFGAGPFTQFLRSNRTSTTSSGFSTSTRTKTKGTTWAAGISGVLGVEWFATRSISFVAEYSSNLGYNSASQTDTAEQKTGTSGYTVTNELKRKSKGLQLSSGFVRFGLSVYF
jgi:hypothetical protein